MSDWSSGFLAGLGIGFILGALLGLIIVSLCIAANDRHDEEDS